MKYAVLSLMLTTLVSNAFAQRYGGGRYGDRDIIRPHRGMGQQVLQLHINQEFRGNSIIPIKAKLKQQYPHLNIQNLKVLQVNLMAKSRMGRGEASLITGYNSTYPVNVPGNPRMFDMHSPRTFAHISLYNSSLDSRGKVQVELRGNIKVRVIDVVIQKQVQRNKVVNVMLHGQLLQGQNTLALKRLIKQQNPNLQLADMELKKVVLVAKSRAGRAQAVLVTGHSESYPTTIFQGYGSFRSNAAHTYNEVQLLPNAYNNGMGKWQIKLRGNVKVHSVKVVMKNKYNNGNDRRRGGRLGLGLGISSEI